MIYFIDFINARERADIHKAWLINANDAVQKNTAHSVHLYHKIKAIKDGFPFVSITQSDNLVLLENFEDATPYKLFFSQGSLPFDSSHVLLFNPFEIRSEQMDECYEMWHQAHKHMSRQDGFVGVNFFKTINDEAKFKFVNMAAWESENKILQAIEDPFYHEHRKRASKFKMHPALFKHSETVYGVTGMTSNYIREALQELDIPVNEINDSAKLGDELGMDSQEIVELTVIIENKVAKNLPANFFNRSLSIAEAESKLHNHLDSS